MNILEMSVVYGLVVMGLTAWSCRKSGGNLLNPVSLHTLAFAMQLLLYLGLATAAEGAELNFSLLEEPLNVVFNYLICTVFFSLAWMGWHERHPYLAVDSRASQLIDVRNVQLVVSIEMAMIGCVILLVIAIIGFPLLEMVRGNLDIQQMNAMVADLPFGLLGVNVWLGILLSLNLATMLVYRAQYRRRPRELAFLLAVIVFSSVFYAKRQVLVMLLFFLFVLAASNRSRRAFNWRQVLGGFAALLTFIAIYLAVQFVRIGTTGDFQVLELPLSALWPLINFDRLATSTHELGHLSGLVSQIIPNRLFGHAIEDIKDVLFEPSASVGYVQYAFHDFGTTGVAGAAFVLGVLTRLASFAYRGSVTGLQIRVLALWVCATAPFYSHGFSNNYFLVPVALLLALRFLLGSRSMVVPALAK
ncbi:MAG: oligosaccharide repeat unit polymerase [Ramlibacter sp.]|nr:oligosaccharide repeat unit polymerase [Ramlibacter sp.]